MPTADRRRFVPLAVRAFLRQDYPRRELIVMDDGADAIGDLLPDDDRIRYLRVPSGCSLGAKRNACCREARGELIAHWDDDDWIAPDRLSRQVQAMDDSGVEACGLDRLYFCNPEAGTAWIYRYPAAQRPWVAGGTLMYRRSVWAEQPFPDITTGEDTRFVWNLAPNAVHALDALDMYVARVHSKNTSPKKTRSARWHPVDLQSVRRAVGTDWPLFARQRPVVFFDNPQATHPPAPPSSEGTMTERDADAGGHAAARPRVTVSLAYYGCRDHIRQAVTSILGQTYDHLRLVVVNDGDPNPPWDLLDDIDDPRLIRFDLSANRGRYAADDIVLAATDDPLFLLQDADDWSAPDRLEKLLHRLRETNAEAVFSDHTIHRSNGRTTPETHRKIVEPLTDAFRHRAHHHALYATGALRRIGGYDGGFRIGYDTLLVNLLRMTASVANLDEAVYHRRVRPGSLTQNAETGYYSARRRRVSDDLRTIYATALSAYREYCSGQRSRAFLLRTIRSLTAASDRAPDQAAGKKADVQRLRKALANPAERTPASNGAPAPDHARPEASSGRTTPARKATRKQTPERRIDALIEGLPTTTWTLSPAALQALARRLREIEPEHVIEVGSGVSTAVLAHDAASRGSQVTTLEHDETFFRKTDRLLRRLGLRRAVDLRHGPLRSLSSRPSAQWYDVDLSDRPPASLALIDGPPQSEGRSGTLPALLPHLAPGWEVWLDDGHRDHEIRCLRAWSDEIPFTARRRDMDEKGQWILRDAAAGRSNVDPTLASRVACTLLTGRRPRVLRDTLNALQQHSPGFLKHATLIVLINSPDPDTRAIISGLDHVDRVLVHDGPLLSIGVATSRLMAEVSTLPDSVDTVLHLEDDWRAHTFDAGWLARGLSLLDTHERIGQVRLRDAADRVLRRHMITNRPIQWTPLQGDRRASSAHFTFNPSLVRRKDLTALFPCEDETEAQRLFLKAGFASAQLVPGTFTHIGDEDSLRRRARASMHART